MTGAFITLEGGEGSGKSTQLQLLASAFANASLPCLVTREPGGTVGAERIRALLVNGEPEAWDPMAETLLFYAARLDHVRRAIKPALARNDTVLCDRFIDSTLVYQGMGKGLGEEFIADLHRLTLGNFVPDLTVILDIEPSIGVARTRHRQDKETRFEKMNSAFHKNIHTAFLNLAKSHPQRCVIVDALQTRYSLHEQLCAIIAARFGLKLTACHE